MTSFTKSCAKCGEIKPLTEFNKDSRAKDGYRTDCKACKQKLDEAYRELKRLERANNPVNTEVDSSTSMKKCSKCGELKSLTEFNKDSKTKDGYRSDCKVCKLKVDEIYNRRKCENFFKSIVDERIVNLIKKEDIFKMHINSNHWYTKSERPEIIKALRGLFESLYKQDAPLCIEENFSQYIANIGNSTVEILMKILFEYCENPDKIKSINDEKIKPINVQIVTNSLALIKYQKSYEQMIELLKKYLMSISSVPKKTDNTRIVYDNIFFALAKMDSHETARNLISLLDDAAIKNIDVKDLIVSYLSYVPDKLGVEPLIKLILTYNDPDYGDGEQEDITYNAAEVLGTIGDPFSIPNILELIKSKNELIRWNGLHALQIFAQFNYTKELEVAVVTLIEALQDKDENVRVTASEVLGYLKDERAVLPIINLLDDEDELVREQAVLSLVELGDIRAVEPLIKRLELEEDNDIMIAIIEALGHMKDERALQPLIYKFDRKADDVIKYAIITELGHMKDKRAIEFLTSRLSGEEEDSDIYCAIICSIDEINGIIDENYKPIVPTQ